MDGDTLLEAAKEAAEKAGGQVTVVHLRDKRFGYCRGCYGCAEMGVCVQEDDFKDVLALLHEADAVIAAAPVYYNCMDALMLTAVDRLCCTFACKTYPPRAEKVEVFTGCGAKDTCAGSPGYLRRAAKVGAWAVER